jgi:hypothetical protein
MSKISRISRYFADDKDIRDLVSQGTVTHSKLIEVLRRRGVIVSPQADKIELCRYFQRLQFSWPQLVELLEILDRPERDDRFTNFRIEGTAAITIDQALSAADKLKSERGGRHNEVYTLSKSSDKSMVMAVEFSEPDYSKTRLRQHQEHTIHFTIDQTDSGLQVRHSSGAKGSEIAARLQKLLAAEDTPPLTRREIVLSGLSSERRSRFFVELARGIQGYKLIDQNGLRVDRPESTDEDDDDDDDAADDNKKVTAGEKAMQGLVKRAVLQGSALLSSAEYQEYKSKGYSMSKLDWVAESDNEKAGWVEFMAEFQNGPEGTGFKYGVLGKWDRKDDGARTKTRRAVTPQEKEQLLRLMEDGAYKALDSVSQDESSNQV